MVQSSLDNQGSNPAWAIMGFISLHHIYTGSGTHPAYYPLCTRGSYPEGKVAVV